MDTSMGERLVLYQKLRAIHKDLHHTLMNQLPDNSRNQVGDVDSERECRKSGSGHFLLRFEVFPQPRKSLGNRRFRELIKTFSALSERYLRA